MGRFATGLQGKGATFAPVMKEKEHLPFFGIGPYYVGVIAVITGIGLYLSRRGYLDGGLVPALRVPMLVLGVVVILLGAFIWGYAFFRSRIDEGIKNNRLVTDGIYAWCRNPLYTGWMLICIGVSLFAGNLWLLILPVIFSLLMAVTMKFTEEKWLRELYGAEYEAYCRRVNRVWPWFPKKNVAIYGVEGMYCSHCKGTVERAAREVEGVTSARANLRKNTLTVKGTATEDAIREAVDKTGYRLVK